MAWQAAATCPAQSLPVSRTGTGCFFFLKKVLPVDAEREVYLIYHSLERLLVAAPFCHLFLGHTPALALLSSRQGPSAPASPPRVRTYELGQRGQDAVVGDKEVVAVAELPLRLRALVLGPAWGREGASA